MTHLAKDESAEAEVLAAAMGDCSLGDGRGMRMAQGQPETAVWTMISGVD